MKDVYTPETQRNPILRRGRPPGGNALRKPKIYLCRPKNKPSCWVVDLRGHDGRRMRLYYATKEEATTKAHVEYIRLSNEGIKASTIPAGFREEALKCKNLLEGTGTSLEEAIRFFLSRRPKTEEKILDDAAKLFLEDRKVKSKRARSIKSFRGSLDAFRAWQNYGHRKLFEITTKEIENYLNKKEWAPKTKNNHLGTLKTFFNYSIKQGWCQANPAKEIEKIEIVSATPVVWTPAEAQTLLQKALELQPDILACLSIGFFGGIRTSELLQLEVGMVKWDEKLIDIPASISKTKRRRLVPISTNLAEWLAVSPLPKSGKLFLYNEKAWRMRIKVVAKAAGLAWRSNAVRHSFATYHLAEHSNEALTALVSGNSVGMLNRHYNAVASQKTAKEFWEIRPKKLPLNSTASGCFS